MAFGRNFEEAIQKAARMVSVSGKASAPVRMVCVGGALPLLRSDVQNISVNPLNTQCRNHSFMLLIACSCALLLLLPSQHIQCICYGANTYNKFKTLYHVLVGLSGGNAEGLEGTTDPSLALLDTYKHYIYT